jgi:hypothetical protein
MPGIGVRPRAQCVVNPYYGGAKQRGQKRRRDY